ncbi:DNA translocase FtsK 4TM domain-containing protein, partial [bacterium AH-315-P15]|nr:DNA translocase FtsK 4TM domain-containing protein [bacterium AH-315-P15]
GIVIGLISLAGVVALLSYAPSDASLNSSGSGVIQNILGAPGAIFADLMWQNIGLGTLALLAPLAVWGWLAMAKAPLPFIWGRIIAWALGIVFISAAVATLPFAAPEPLTSGLGGLLGGAVIAGIEMLAAAAGTAIHPWGFGLIGAGLAALGLFAMSFAMGLRRGDIADIATSAMNLWWLAYDNLTDLVSRLMEARTRAPVAPRMPRPVRPRRTTKEDPPAPRRTRAPKVTRSQRRTRQGKRVTEDAQPTLDLVGEDYRLPALSLLKKALPAIGEEVSDDSLQQNARLLESVLNDYGVRGEITNVRPGPVVTLYELEPAAGIKASRVIGLADDIARSMSAISARVAVVPGKSVIGIELPNSRREQVGLRELLSTAAYENTASRLALTLGKGIGGEPVIVDLSTMPHLLIAGTTGSGKSVAINTMILSLLYRLPPDRCKLILIDPKMLELSVYDGIPHLLTPVVTDAKKAVVALKWTVREMEDRYRRMSKLGVRNIQGFNDRISDAIESGETLTRTIQTGFDKQTGAPIYETETIEPEAMPFIVVVVDEMADLMMVAGKDIEGAVQRLAQMARAAGIHLITATQRPSVDVITGTIKANFPTRISFQVSSKIDSRTVLGEQGAEQLLGNGDMLYMAGGGRIRRVHGPFVSDGEVEQVVRVLKKQGRPNYIEDVTRDPDPGEDVSGGFGGGKGGDELYDQAVAIVARDRKVSTSYVQRKLQIGYNRAARIIERMEEDGVISGPSHSGKREVLVSDHSEF